MNGTTPQPSPFSVLWQAFVEQFVANESATSELQTRRAIIGVVTFLITPGLFLMMRTVSNYELTVKIARAKHMPELIDMRLAQLALLFVSYSMVTTGLIAVVLWDALVFDKRDAMVLGPLPLRGGTVVGAKLAALATLLIGTTLAVNVTSALAFGFVTGGPEGHFLRHLVGHLAGTLGGAVFVFSVLVAVRNLLVLLVAPQLATTVGSLLQFAFLSAVLCFMMVPTVVGTSIPPTSWFYALFELVRGSTRLELWPQAQRAVIALLISVGAAIALTFFGYRKQIRSALAPPDRPWAAARVRRTIASLLTGRDRTARAVSDFVLTTLARCRPQQVPIATSAAVGVAIASIGIATREGGLAELQVPRTAVLWIPLLLGYWTVVGLRASFVIPAELPAAWSLSVHAKVPSVSHWVGVRAAMVAFALGPALLTNVAVVLPLLGTKIAAVHTVIVALVVTIAAQFASLLVDAIPFTRPYPPGHARLRTRWPLYVLGMYVVAYFPVQYELWILRNSQGWGIMGLGAVVIIGALEVAGRRKSKNWTLPTVEELEADPDSATYLNLGPDAAVAPSR